MSKSRRRRPSGSEDGYLVSGERAVSELLAAAPQRVRRLLLDAGRDLSKLAARAQQAGVAPQRVSAGELRAAAGFDPRGVLAVADPPPVWELGDLIAAALDPKRPRPTVLLALDGVVDPQNLGAIMRTAEFFGAGGILWPKDRAAPVTPAVVRASAGASERLPLCVVTNLAAALSECAEAGFWIVGTVAQGGAALAPMCLADELPSELVLVMGSEDRGLRRLTRDCCDFLVTLPRRGEVGSLNVGAATAVCLGLLTSLTSGPKTAVTTPTGDD